MILSVIPISVTVSFYFAKVGISPTALHPNMNPPTQKVQVSI